MKQTTRRATTAKCPACQPAGSHRHHQLTTAREKAKRTLGKSERKFSDFSICTNSPFGLPLPFLSNCRVAIVVVIVVVVVILNVQEKKTLESRIQMKENETLKKQREFKDKEVQLRREHEEKLAQAETKAKEVSEQQQ